MDETYNLSGIVLGREPYRESDSRVVVYSREEGKLELVARGAKKIKSKLAAHLEPFNLVNIMAVRGRQFDYVGTAVSQSGRSALKQSLDNLLAAGAMAGAVNRYTKFRDPDQRIFALFDAALSGLEASDSLGRQNILLIFYLKLVNLLGYRPELYHCLKCGEKLVSAQFGFDSSSGGVVCAQCQPMKSNLTISDNCLKILRFWLDNDWESSLKLKADQSLLNEAKRIVSSLKSYYLS